MVATTDDRIARLERQVDRLMARVVELEEELAQVAELKV
jgi:ubiquinone biosynthesis protein UbiJ